MLHRLTTFPISVKGLKSTGRSIPFSNNIEIRTMPYEVLFLNHIFNFEIIQKSELDYPLALKCRQEVVFCKKCVLNPLMRNVPKMVRHTLKILQHLLQDI